MKTLSPKQIREIAYNKLIADWKTPCLLALVYIVVVGGLSQIPFVGILIAIFLGLPLGYALYNAMKHFRDGEGEVSLQYMIDQLKNNYERSFLTMFFIELFVCLWTLLLIVPGVIKAYAYSLATYIAEENPEMRPIDCLKKSEEIMKGHKMDLFILDLTFLGWILLGIVTCGIGLIFVEPYMLIARAEFYRELTATEEAPAEEPAAEEVVEEAEAVEEKVEETIEEATEETAEETKTEE